MKIALTATGTTWDSIIDPRFGRAENIVLYDEESQKMSVIDNSTVKNEAYGAGTVTAQRIFELKPDVLITGNGPGKNASDAFKHLNIKIFVNAYDMTLRQAYEHFKNGELQEL